VPLRNPDFAPFLQRVRDSGADALFTFVPAGVGSALMKQFSERGLDKSGMRMIATGDVTDDDILNDMGDVALGIVTSHHYSAAHKSASNQKFVDAFGKANKGMRPNFMAVGGYDGMRVIVEGLKATKGAGGDALLAAMKGQVFESPRGPVMIDAQTRDIVQDVYIRKVEKVNGQLYNVEFETQKAVKDPGKTK
jgi:branched-chain amino acid transport system substrate-binding protein